MSKARDHYREFYTEKLWEWIPAFYRDQDGGDVAPRVYQDAWIPAGTLDPHATGPLYAFVRALAQQAALLKRSQDRLWHDNYVELADDWAIPYLADLVATRLVSALNVRARRVDVAKTIFYRRRKGTLRVLEQLIADMTGWDGVVVEEFRRLARMRHGLDPVATLGRCTGTPAGGIADIRRPRGALLVGTPFDEYHYTPDFRRPRGRTGRYGIPKLGFHLHRLLATEVAGVTPRLFTVISPNVRAFTFDPSGRDAPLFATNSPRADFEGWHSAREYELPRPISCYLLNEARFVIGDREIADVRNNGALTAAQRTAVAADLATLAGMLWKSEGDLRLVLGSRPQSALLLTPAVLDPLLFTSLDPLCGRSALLPPVAVPPPGTPIGSVNVQLTSGGVTTLVPRADTEGGSLAGDPLTPNVWPLPFGPGARLLRIDPERGRFVLDQAGAPGADLSVRYFCGFPGPCGAGGWARNIDAPTGVFNTWGAGSSAAGVRVNGLTFVADSVTYAAPPGAAAIVDARLLAADGARPYLRLAANWVLGTAGVNRKLTLDGLWVGASVAASLILDGDYETVDLRFVTLDPGGVDAVGAVLAPVPLLVRGRVEHLRIDRCIFSSVRVLAGGSLETLTITDSIAQAAAPGARVIDAPLADVRIERSTILAARESDLAIDVETLYASELLCTGKIDVTNTQTGCFRFSARASGSRVPHPYESHVIADTGHYFTSRRFGDPGYAQLSDSAPEFIVRGAESGAEIGAWASLINPIKHDSLLAKTGEYMPFGLIPALVHET
ncbi:MAG: hypothetical protein U1F54_00225 [Burkholderiales bacterium]